MIYRNVGSMSHWCRSEVICYLGMHRTDNTVSCKSVDLLMHECPTKGLWTSYNFDPWQSILHFRFKTLCTFLPHTCEIYRNCAVNGSKQLHSYLIKTNTTCDIFSWVLGNLKKILRFASMAVIASRCLLFPLMFVWAVNSIVHSINCSIHVVLWPTGSTSLTWILKYHSSTA